MLSRERETIGSNGGSEHLAVKMKTGDRCVDGSKRVLVDDGTTDQVTELDDICHGLDDRGRDVTSNGGEVHLDEVSFRQFDTVGTIRTFIRPFESFPVHCLYPLPV